MATSTEDLSTKLTFRKYKEGDDKWKRMDEMIFDGDATHKCPTYVHQTPPCQGSCPAGEDIRGWLQIVRGIEKPAEGVSMALTLRQEYSAVIERSGGKVEGLIKELRKSSASGEIDPALPGQGESGRPVLACNRRCGPGGSRAGRCF